MQAIVDMLTGFFDLVMQLVQFIFKLLGDLVFVLQTLTQFVANIPTYFMWLPPGIVAIVVVSFSLVVIYMVLNRK